MITQQDFIHMECQRWQEGRWLNQKQAIAVGISKYKKYLQTKEIPFEIEPFEIEEYIKGRKKIIKIK